MDLTIEKRYSTRIIGIIMDNLGLWVGLTSNDSITTNNHFYNGVSNVY